MYQERVAARPWLRRERLLPLLGPAFVTAVAYVDPGNFATNLSAGSRYGYLLVWVVLAGNLMAMLVQYLSAKVGIATGSSIAALCRDQYSTFWRFALWAQAEAIAVATDLAEVVGGAIALRLLFGLPLLVGGLLTAVVAFSMLSLRSRGHRPFEAAVTGMLGVILVGFIYSVATGPTVQPTTIAAGIAPHFDGTGSVLLAAGMLGATVMPHAIYLHSGLTTERASGRSLHHRQRLLRAQRLDVVLAMTIAGLMNLAILVIAAASLSGQRVNGSIETAHQVLGRVNGQTTAVLFAMTLLASGFAASSVGTLAGQVVMDGFLQRRIPLSLRRLASLAPAVVVLAVCTNPTSALVASQVILSFGIPFVLVPLIMFTRDQKLMGPFVNRASTTAVAVLVAMVIIALNVFLIGTTLLALKTD